MSKTKTDYVEKSETCIVTTYLNEGYCGEQHIRETKLVRDAEKCK